MMPPTSTVTHLRGESNPTNMQCLTPNKSQKYVMIARMNERYNHLDSRRRWQRIGCYWHPPNSSCTGKWQPGCHRSHGWTLSAVQLPMKMSHFNLDSRKLSILTNNFFFPCLQHPFLTFCLTYSECCLHLHRKKNPTGTCTSVAKTTLQRSVELLISPTERQAIL